MKHININLNIADTFTKPLLVYKFIEFRKEINIS